MGFILFTLVPMVLHGGFAEQLLLDEAVIKKKCKQQKRICDDDGGIGREQQLFAC